MTSLKTSQNFTDFNRSRYQSDKDYANSHIRMSLMASFIPKHQKILDIGCGDGTFFTFIKNTPKKNLYGVDISPKVANLAKKRCSQVKIANLHQQFPYSNNSFDCVTAGEIIEHIYDTDFFLSEIKRILKPNGFLVLSTPNLATLGRRLMLLIGINPLIDTSLRDSAGHIRYFTFGSLNQLLSYHKFKITNFTSDVVNFNNRGTLKSRFLAKLFPKLGARLIIKAKNLK